jgi:hypothetical protein
VIPAWPHFHIKLSAHTWEKCCISKTLWKRGVNRWYLTLMWSGRDRGNTKAVLFIRATSHFEVCSAPKEGDALDMVGSLGSPVLGAPCRIPSVYFQSSAPHWTSGTHCPRGRVLNLSAEDVQSILHQEKAREHVSLWWAGENGSSLARLSWYIHSTHKTLYPQTARYFSSLS